MPLHQASGKWRLGLCLSLITISMWGVEPIALTITLQAVDIYTLGWFRFLVCFLLLGIFLAVRQQLPTLQKLRAASVNLFAIAIIFLAINYVLFLKGLSLTTPSTGEVLIQLAPIFMGLGALVIFKERYTYRQWLGLGILTLGFTLFFHEKVRTLATATNEYLIGSALIVLSAVAWAIYSLAQKQLLQKLSSIQIMLILYGSCAVIIGFFANPQSLLTLSPFYWGMLAFCTLNTLLAYGAFAEALEHWEASKISAILPLSPLITFSVMGLLSFLGNTWIKPEHITVLGFLGAGLVVSGSIAIALGEKTEAKL